MKKRFAIIALILVFSILTLSGCELISKIPGLGSGVKPDGGDVTPDGDGDNTEELPSGEEKPDEKPDNNDTPADPGDDNPGDNPGGAGDSTDKYKITYSDLEGWLIEGYAPVEAAAGETVFIRAYPIMDAVLELYANGILTDCPYADYDYWEYCFVMPATDVVITKNIVDGFLPDPTPEETKPMTVYLVGDSTVCGFADAYYYPRYGYGTQLENYLDDKATVVNLALSGRSSKSFTAEANYETLKNSIKAGDYLIIGFGHNDEKSEDVSRFTDASLPYTDDNSFGYSLYVNYIKLALDAGATPILCTPIVRAATDDDYTGSEGHITANGDYAKAIRDLGAAVGVDVVDLTAITAAEYSSKGFDAIKKYHAITVGKLDTDGKTVVPNWDSIDKTHLNLLGAKFVAYNLACELAKLGGIGRYVLEDITAPTDADLVVNPDYIYSDYTAPTLSEFGAQEWFSTTTEGWYGTAFGDTGGNPTSSSNGYFATETSEGVFKVGQTLESGSNKGKFSSSSDGFAFLFTQVKADQNFKISVTATILNSGKTKQAGFGLMLRDDCYLPEQNSAIKSNYLTAGLLCDGTNDTYACFGRENASLFKGASFGQFYQVGETYTMSIERIGQTVILTVSLGDKTVSQTHYDFDLLAKDGEYMYVGMFANRGTLVEFTNLSFEITGTSQGA